MNKKAYTAPTMEAMNVETVEMIATSLAMFSEDEVDTSTEGGQLGAGRRGSWGNLWEK